MGKDEGLFFPGLFFNVSVGLLENFGHGQKLYKVVSSTTEFCNGCAMETAGTRSVSACQALQSSSSRLGCWWGYQEMCYRECSKFWDGGFHLLLEKLGELPADLSIFLFSFYSIWRLECTVFVLKSLPVIEVSVYREPLVI